jgi:hypothetical protein
MRIIELMSKQNKTSNCGLPHPKKNCGENLVKQLSLIPEFFYKKIEKSNVYNSEFIFKPETKFKFFIVHLSFPTQQSSREICIYY